MLLSREKANRALDILVERGLIVPDQISHYKQMIENGVSYRKMLIGELGVLIGELYVKEEQAQHLIMHSLDMDLDRMSVPEALLIEDDPVYEPWHAERFSESSPETRFRSEASEPWHVSLKEKFKPIPALVSYFDADPKFKSLTHQILCKAYEVSNV